MSNSSNKKRKRTSSVNVSETSVNINVNDDDSESRVTRKKAKHDSNAVIDSEKVSASIAHTNRKQKLKKRFCKCSEVDIGELCEYCLREVEQLKKKQFKKKLHTRLTEALFDSESDTEKKVGRKSKKERKKPLSDDEDGVRPHKTPKSSSSSKPSLKLQYNGKREYNENLFKPEIMKELILPFLWRMIHEVWKCTSNKTIESLTALWDDKHSLLLPFPFLKVRFMFGA